MKFKKITLYTSALSSLKEFYENTLELEVTSLSKEEMEVKAGESILHFKENEDKACNYHFAFNIPENKIDEAFEWLKDKVSVVIDPESEEQIIDFSSWNAHSIYFQDPAGNVLECIARHNLKNSSERKFDGNSFLNISEIGIPGNNVKELFDPLHDYFQMGRYSGDFESFCAAGNEEGLFILVPLNRTWYPTRIPSSAAPLIIEAEHAGKKGTIFYDSKNLKIQ